MKSEKEAKEESMAIAALLMLGAALSLLISASGCSGARAYIGYERVDEYERTERMKPTPWACLFSDCKGGVEK